MARSSSMSTASSLLILFALATPAACFNIPLRGLSTASVRSACVSRTSPTATPIRAQYADPDRDPVVIPDTFNPAEWGPKPGDGGGGLGGGFKVPDSFNPMELEREKSRSATAVLERPRLDPGKKYKVLLFNDEKNTREFVMDTLIKAIPGMTGDKANLITNEAHNNGMAVVGIWMFELAEAYSDVLNSAGLRSEVEEE